MALSFFLAGSFSCRIRGNEVSLYLYIPGVAGAETEALSAVHDARRTHHVFNTSLNKSDTAPDKNDSARDKTDSAPDKTDSEPDKSASAPDKSDSALNALDSRRHSLDGAT